MIKHCVFLKFRAEGDAAEHQAILTGLAALVGQIDGFLRFSHGPNRDFEAKSPGYSHGFVAEFADAAALRAYAEDPRHQALGQRLVTACDGGAAGIMVYDLEV